MPKRPRFGLGLVLLGALLVPANACAQTVNLVRWPSGLTQLDTSWRTHAGDNRAWAGPGFDDSAWPVFSLDAPNDYAGWRWYRLRVQLPAQHSPLALLVTGGEGTCEIFVNGRRLPGPRLLSSIFVTNPRSRIFRLPTVAGGAVIALRTHVPSASMFLADRGAFRVELGTLSAIDHAHRAELSSRVDTVVLGIGIHLLLFLAGISALILFWYQRDHREYLWLGLYLLLDASGTILYELGGVTSFVPYSVNWFCAAPTVYFATIAQIEFTFSFVDQRVTRPWRVYEWILLIPPVFLVVPAWFDILNHGLFDVGEISLIIPAAVALPVLLFLWYRRGYREAAWLILPSLLPMFTVALNDAGIVGNNFHWPRLAALADLLPLGLFSLEPFDIGDLVFLLAIGIVMFFRFTRVSREQARAAAELEAAREIQQRLVPLGLPTVPGCRIESVYLPAEEVGGDFYQVLEQTGDITLIVIGDVSGKGLKAAMTGTLVLGALRNMAQENLSPSQILSRLNSQLASSSDGGFVTCLCARIAAYGSLTLANAGHLAPYRNGEEIPLDSGLPLGVTADTTYVESTVQLAPCDRLTFLSDGVVEAGSATGELFGFDRTRAISTQSAEEIARAAQAFGQQDDITVLTLTFAPAEVLHA
jgi:phosphoserine phosphatase RsbU/P